MNNKVGVKIISSVLLGTMCFYTMPVFANTKEEVVYSNASICKYKRRSCLF